MFVMCFTGKPLVSGQSGRSVDAGGGAAKNGKADAKKIFINNNLLNVDKELKKNKKQEDYGFIPASWKIVRLGKDGKGETEIAAGAADFCIVEENWKQRDRLHERKTYFCRRGGAEAQKARRCGFLPESGRSD